jgi:hypothetical protein
MVSVLVGFCACEGKARRISKDPNRKRIVQNRSAFISFTSKKYLYPISPLKTSIYPPTQKTTAYGRG